VILVTAEATEQAYKVRIMNTTPLDNGARNELYAELSAELRTELAKYERFVTVPAGTQLIKHSVLPEQLIILHSGKVEITLAGMQESFSLDGAETGKVFGMRAVVSGELPEVDVTSRENCRITLIPRDAFLTIVRAHSEMYFAIAKVLSNDLVMAQRFLKISLRHSARRKTAAKPFLSWPN
jgi:CRP-like cAMP-binding protein